MPKLSTGVIKLKCEICGRVIDSSLREYNLKVKRNANYKFICKGCQIKKTCLEKYGVSNVSQVRDFQLKKEETSEKHFGVKHPAQSKVVKDKMHQTNLERRGCWPMQSEAIKQKAKETYLQKYGVESQNQVESVKKKKMQTCLKHYGVEWPSLSKEVRERQIQACVDKYGTPFVAQNKEVNQKLKDAWKNKSDEEMSKWIKKHRGKYKYDNVCFDSSWELAVWIYCKDKNIDIKREPCTLSYEYNRETHRYFPDFEIDGKLVEIKGSQFFKKDIEGFVDIYDKLNEEKLRCKMKCAIQNNVEIWMYEDIKPYLDYVNTVYGKSYLASFKTP